MQEPSVKESADGTIKICFEGYSAVIIPSKNDKNTVCVSSQIGCRLPCAFCRSGPFRRDLSIKEIVGQFEAATELIRKRGIRTRGELSKTQDLKPTSVVIMGMGEPMLNFDAVSKAIEHIHSDYHIPYKRITLSTAGIGLDMLEDVAYNVAISLHFPDDQRRAKHMGSCVASINDIITFSRLYSRTHRYGVLIEYLLLEEINDSSDDINLLLSYDWPSETNFNIVECSEVGTYKASKNSLMFKQKIIKAGYKCFIRSRRGHDIEASCGMLSQRA